MIGKKVVSLCLTWSLIFSCSFMMLSSEKAYSASVQDRINEATRNKQEALNKINKSKKEKQAIMAKKDVIDHEIDLIQSELDAIDAIISDADQKIADADKQIADYEQKIEDNDQAFRQRLRAMDENNSASYVDILFESKSFADFFARLETIREITEHDQSIINEMMSLKQGVEEIRKEQVIKRDEQLEARSLVNDKKKVLDAKMREQNAIISQINNDIALQEKIHAEASRLEQQLKDSIAPSLSKSSSSKYTGGKFVFPAPSMSYVSSQYGYRTHPVTGVKYKFHSGMDLAAPQGSNILAAEAGTVRMAGWNGGYGYCVIIDHGGGVATLYGHSSKLLVSAGQSVSRGQIIAKVGSTGVSTGPHLHFEVLINGATTNPAPYIGLG